MLSSGVMHGDGRQRGEEMVKHEVKKRNIAAVLARYCNIVPHFLLSPPSSCTLLPSPCAHGPQVLLSLPPLSSTTTNSSRFDSLLICLGWLHCCTLLPSLHVDLKSCRCHPPYLAQPPTQADSTHRLSVLVGYVVVPCFLLSVPMDLKSCRCRSPYLVQLPT